MKKEAVGGGESPPQEGSMEEIITICDDKYTLIFNNENGDFRALRYGKKWRSLVGDKLVFGLFCELQAAQRQMQGSSYAAGNAAEVDESEWSANNVTG